MAEESAAATGRRDRYVLHTLVVAHEAAGDTARARIVAQRALSLSEKARDESLGEDLRRRIATYTPPARATTCSGGLGDGSRAGERAAWRAVTKHAPDKSESDGRRIIKTWTKNGVLVSQDSGRI